VTRSIELSASLQFVSDHLRVPEYKYDNSAQVHDESHIKALVEQLYEQGLPEDYSVNTARLNLFPDKTFPPRFLNLAFFIDRCFDVWARKTPLDAFLIRELQQWKISCLLLSYRNTDLVPLFNQLVDTVSTELVGWSPKPERAKTQLLDFLRGLDGLLRSNLTEVSIKEALAQWRKRGEDAEQKSERILSRLAASEGLVASKRFASAMSQQHINNEFAERRLSMALQTFLENDWVHVLSQALVDAQTYSLPEPILLTTRKLRAVFCDKGRAAFQFGEDLVDELIELSEHYHVPLDRDTIALLSEQTIDILKKQSLSEMPFQPLRQAESLDLFDAGGLTLQEGQWLLCQETAMRLRVTKIFAQEGQVLLTNYLGMKQGLETVSSLAHRLSNKTLTLVEIRTPFSAVFESTLNGLKKVATTQLDAREKAAEKAREEAMRIQEEQTKAAEQARAKAEEIAKRTREMAARKEEAKRLEAEKQAVESLSLLNLGAWVSISGAGEQRQRFKLAVKFAAKKRYVFVDKYGVKKVEFKEHELVEAMTDQRLEILSDGADFDDSLERVIGRMRMSR